MLYHYWLNKVGVKPYLEIYKGASKNSLCTIINSKGDKITPSIINNTWYGDYTTNEKSFIKLFNFLDYYFKKSKSNHLSLEWDKINVKNKKLFL